MRLNAIIRAMADRFGATYVDTATPFVGHEAAYTSIDEVGAGETVPPPFGPTDSGVAPVGNVYPNETGYGVIANRVLVALAAGTPVGGAGTGGGVSVGGAATVVLTRSVVQGNTAAASGGGLFNGGTLTASTTGVLYNRARTGGGLFSNGDGMNSLADSVDVAGNLPDQSVGFTLPA